MGENKNTWFNQNIEILSIITISLFKDRTGQTRYPYISLCQLVKKIEMENIDIANTIIWLNSYFQREKVG
jgi:hypothetical protein